MTKRDVGWRETAIALRAILAAAACSLAAAASGADALVLYFNESGERVTAAVGKLRKAIDAQGIAARHRVVVEHVPVDYSDTDAIRRSLRSAAARRPAAIIAAFAGIAQLARDEVPGVPVLFAMWQDPIQQGVAESFRRPGGSMTGITFYRSDEGKRLELLREIAPRARRLGVVIDEWWDHAPDDKSPSMAVLAPFAEGEFGFQVEYFEVNTLNQLEHFASKPGARAMDAWYVTPTRLGFDHPAEMARAISAMRKPAIYSMSIEAQNGGLLSYQTIYEDPFASWAKMLALILEGFPAGEIPIERPRAFELAVNVKAAREQGIALPKSILLRATHFY